MNINGIEVQGIRKVHIEDVVGNAEKVWERIAKLSTVYGDTAFVWRGYETPECEQDPIKTTPEVPDKIILDLIRWVFKLPEYNARIKGDTVYIKVTSRSGIAWTWGAV